MNLNLTYAFGSPFNYYTNPFFITGFSLNSQSVITSFSNGSVFIYEKYTGNFTAELTGSTSVYSLLATEKHIYAGTIIGTIRVYDRAGIFQSEFSAHGSRINILFSLNQYIVSTAYSDENSAFQNIKFWDMNTLEWKGYYELSKSGKISALNFQGNVFYVAACDRNIVSHQLISPILVQYDLKLLPKRSLPQNFLSPLINPQRPDSSSFQIVNADYNDLLDTVSLVWTPINNIQVNSYMNTYSYIYEDTYHFGYFGGAGSLNKGQCMPNTFYTMSTSILNGTWKMSPFNENPPKTLDALPTFPVYEYASFLFKYDLFESAAVHAFVIHGGRTCFSIKGYMQFRYFDIGIYFV